ncbi:MAG: endonuclease/exonuclease/phosphatase family protein [Planctomycetota bacterium]|jgi:endonuclease/exonuclease/phosphatase family metal-dependent hydrolase
MNKATGFVCRWRWTGIAIGWILWLASTTFAAEPIRVMCFNIRYGTANDGVNRWENRRTALMETIQRFDPDLLGTQETLAFQRDYLLEQLSGFATVAVGRDDGKEKGEMAALFYRKDRFEAIDAGHFWLSEMPSAVGSKGWDAALPRIASWVMLRDRKDPAAVPILFLNTHFDHQGRKARAESARLIASKLHELGPQCRWIVTGDFNADPSEPPYTNLFATDPTSSRRLFDTLRVCHPTPQPDEGTFTGFDVKQTSGSRIDWIGCTEEFSVQSAEIVRDATDGRTPSDHFPVTSVLRPR